MRGHQCKGVLNVCDYVHVTDSKNPNLCLFLCVSRCPWLTKVISPAVPLYNGLVFLFVLANFSMATFMDPGVYPRGLYCLVLYLSKHHPTQHNSTLSLFKSSCSTPAVISGGALSVSCQTSRTDLKPLIQASCSQRYLG